MNAISTSLIEKGQTILIGCIGLSALAALVTLVVMARLKSGHLATAGSVMQVSQYVQASSNGMAIGLLIPMAISLGLSKGSHRSIKGTTLVKMRNQETLSMGSSKSICPTISKSIIQSPFPGKCILQSIEGTPFVKVGDQVEPGAFLFEVECMKMKTAIRAFERGIVKEIYIKQGQIVNSGQSILKIEPN